MNVCTRFPKPCIALGLVLFLASAGSLGFAAESGGVPWVGSLDAAKAQAKAENKLIFMDVYAEWCPPCQKMLKETFTSDAVITALQKYVPLKVDSDKNPEVAQEYGVQALPTLFVLTAEGAPILRQEGFVPAEGFLELLDAAKARLEAIAKLEEDVRMNPNNVTKAIELAREYLDMGRAGDAVTLLERIGPKVADVESDATRAQHAFSLGLAYLVHGVYDKGVQTLEQFIEGYPTHPETERAKDLVLRGKLFDAMTRVDNGEYDQARAILAQLAESTDNPQVTEFVQEMQVQLEVLGRTAPSWAVTWAAGKSASPQELKGKVIALAFVELENAESGVVAARLEALQKDHAAQGLAAVAIVSSSGGAEEADAGAVREWAEEQGSNYPVGIDKQGRSTYERYKGEQAPWMALIGRDGVVHYLGTFDEGEIAEKLARLLAAEA